MNAKILWIVTGLMAIVMLVGAIYIARQRAAVPPAVVAVIKAPEPEIPLPPVVASESATPKPAPVPTPQIPVVYDEVRVDLSKIAGTLKMTSPDIPAGPNGELPRYPLNLTCYRKNASPAVIWRNAPAETKSYVLVLERRAPNEKAGWPWVMYNIATTTNTMPGKMTVDTLTAALGLFGENSYGHQAYTGPCEPKGTFPYVLRLFALDTTLPLEKGATLPEILPLINGHVIDAAEIKAHHYLQM